MSLLLLTGSPGVGKTTALRRVIDALRIEPLSGFFTGEIRVGGAHLMHLTRENRERLPRGDRPLAAAGLKPTKNKTWDGPSCSGSRSRQRIE